MKIATYLYFKLNAKEVIETYKYIFEAEVVREHLYTEEMTCNQALLGKIFHAELKIGDMNLYLSDWEENSSFSSVKFVVEFGDESEARKCLEKISQHGKVIHDFKKMPVGPTLARTKDKFGVNWEIVIC